MIEDTETTSTEALTPAPVPTEAVNVASAAVQAADAQSNNAPLVQVGAGSTPLPEPERNFYNRVDIWLHVFKEGLVNGVDAAEAKAASAVAAFEKLFGK